MKRYWNEDELQEYFTGVAIERKLIYTFNKMHGKQDIYKWLLNL